MDYTDAMRRQIADNLRGLADGQDDDLGQILTEAADALTTPLTPAGIVAAIRRYPVQSDEWSLIEEALKFDHDADSYGVDEARQIRADSRHMWEDRERYGMPPVPPMIPDREEYA